MVLQRRAVAPFTDKQIELLTTFADQAVIAIENARLFEAEQQRTRELTESLEQQTATSEILASMSDSMTDSKPVFDAIVRNLLRLFGTRFATVQLLKDGMVHLAALDGEPGFERLADRFPVPLDDSTLAGRTMLSKQVVRLTPVIGNVATPAATERNARDFGYNSMIFAPMLRADEVIGAIGTAHRDAKAFDDKQAALIKAFADQAVIAIENVRLFEAEQQRTRELAESLEQQTATSEVLKAISGSPGELQPVFETMLENAVRICAAKFGNLWLREGDNFRIGATHGAPPAYAEARRREPVLHFSPNNPLSRMIATKQLQHIVDMRMEQAYIEREPGPVVIAEAAGARTVLLVPMLKENNLIGVVAIYRQEVRPFTDKQIELVTNFAAQAVIAIENTRLLNELRTRTDELAQSVGELQALGEISQAVNSTLDLEIVLTTIVGRAVELSRTDAGAIYVFDEGRKEFRLHATYGMSEAMIAAISDQHIGLGDSNIGAATAQRKPIQVPDIRNQPTPVNEIVLREGYRGILVIPLLRPDHIVGALVVRRKTPGEFPQSTIELLQTFADQSVVAIQNARLFESVEKSLEDLRTAQVRLVQTQKLASLGQLTAGIAHEIKNPLNFVNNFSGVSVELIDELRETLGRVTADDKTRGEIAELADTLRDNLDKIVQHGKRADSIVKNMLLHSREGSGERRLVDVNAIVEESLNLAYHGARAEKQGFNVTLERSFDPTAGEVDVFPQEIARVLLNLISNGFYATTKRQGQESGNGFEPTITAATKSLGDSVEIRIRDNGTGIPPEVREKMFNPFFTTKPAGEGTGLGLSISHDIIVKQHSGSIEVDTEPGQFTEFRIILPRTATQLFAE
jgi:two-component system NtrC family sensor kinase